MNTVVTFLSIAGLSVLGYAVARATKRDVHPLLFVAMLVFAAALNTPAMVGGLTPLSIAIGTGLCALSSVLAAVASSRIRKQSVRSRL